MRLGVRLALLSLLGEKAGDWRTGEGRREKAVFSFRFLVLS